VKTDCAPDMGIVTSEPVSSDMLESWRVVRICWLCGGHVPAAHCRQLLQAECDRQTAYAEQPPVPRMLVDDCRTGDSSSRNGFEAPKRHRRMESNAGRRGSPSQVWREIYAGMSRRLARRDALTIRMAVPGSELRIVAGSPSIGAQQPMASAVWRPQAAAAAADAGWCPVSLPSGALRP
jgi:hypothetical protein